MYKKLFSKQTAWIGGAVLGLMLFATGGIFGGVHKAEASTYELHGFAWSSTVGWISMNCAELNATGGYWTSGATWCSTNNYSVVLDSVTGVTSGHAWSPNVGWISFDAADIAGQCPTSVYASVPATFSSTSGLAQIFGWARVLSGTGTTGVSAGTDGCISFGSLASEWNLMYNFSASSITLPSGGVIPAHSFSDCTAAHPLCAWGDTTLGWVSFSGVSIKLVASPAPVVTLTGHLPGTSTYSSGPLTLPTAIGGSIYLKWVAPSATDCYIEDVPMTMGPIPGYHAIPAIGGTYTTALPSNSGTTAITYVYTLSCVNGISAPGTSTLSITVPPPALSPGTLVLRASAVTGSTYTPATTLPTPTWPFTSPYTPGLVTVSPGSTVTLSWTVTGLAGCTNTSTPANAGWNSASSSTTGTIHTKIVGPFTIPGTYTFSMGACNATSGAGVLPTQWVNVVVPATAITGTCAITPASASHTYSGTSFTSSDMFNVVWTGGPYVPTTVTLDTTGTSFTPTFGTSSWSLPTASSSGVAYLSGPVPTTSASVTLKDSAGICTPATITIGRPAAATHHRPPWFEF
jgi:hypothetical protein